MNYSLPHDYQPYIDKYFLRSKKILQDKHINPYVTAQVFIRPKLPCSVYGIEQAMSIFKKYTSIFSDPKSHIESVKEGTKVKAGDTIMHITAPIQEIIDLETLYLGEISHHTSIKNGFIYDLESAKKKMGDIIKILRGIPMFYFGARHYHWSMDYTLSKIALDAGAVGCSTDMGASSINDKGMGTIPHALECIYASLYGKDNAVKEATKAFHNSFPDIPCIALVDYNNKEITDTRACIGLLQDKLSGIRLDTCGENYMEGTCPSKDVRDPYYDGKGVSISGLLRIHQDSNIKAWYYMGERNHDVILSGGFGNIKKLKAFMPYRDYFTAVGIGEIVPNIVSTTMDIMRVWNDDLTEYVNVNKKGRIYKEIVYE